MAGSFSFGKIDVAAGVAPGAAGEVRRDGPVGIAIFGDFSGRATRAISAPVNLRALQADRDNFDDLPAALGVELSNIITGVDNSPVSIPIKSIDDFHPDALYRSVEGFARLRKTRN